MTISSISYSFTVNRVQFQTEVDTYVNIQKRRETVNYKSVSSASNTNLCFVQGEEVNSLTNLTIDDRSTSLLQNRIVADTENQILEDSFGFSIETDQFLVTNRFTTNLSTQTRIPLYFQHQVNYILGAGEFFQDIDLVDKDFNPISTSTYLVDYDSGIVYSNYKNSFDIITALYKVYYVKYTVKFTSGVIKKYVEILNNLAVFKPATVEDLDETTGAFLPGLNVYLIEENIANHFDILLPTIDDWGIKRNSQTRLSIVSPPPTGVEDPWFVNIRNGSFLSTGETGFNKYYIPEFNTQSFVPYYPYKQTDETSYRVTSRIIKTLQESIVVDDTELLYPSIIIMDKDENIKFGFTADPLLVGTTILDSTVNFSNTRLGDSTAGGTLADQLSDSISSSSIDKNGFIVIPAGYEIKETDIIRSIYTYEEINYQYTLFDFNPLFSSDLAKKRLAIVVRPESIGSSITETLYYLLVNEDGLVIESDIDFTLSGLNDTVENLILVSGLWYDRDPTTASWSTPGSLDFVRECTVEGANNQDDMLILGDIYTRNHIAPNTLILNDIRVRGGGYLDSENSTWDSANWEGQPFPGAAALYVEVPISIIDIADGSLGAAQIHDIAKRHIAQGIYPVVHGYNDYCPTISGIDIVESGFFKFVWSEIPPDGWFNIYDSTDGSDFLSLLYSGVADNSFTYSGVLGEYINVVGYPIGDTRAFTSGPIDSIQLIEVPEVI